VGTTLKHPRQWREPAGDHAHCVVVTGTIDVHCRANNIIQNWQHDRDADSRDQPHNAIKLNILLQPTRVTAESSKDVEL